MLCERHLLFFWGALLLRQENAGLEASCDLGSLKEIAQDINKNLNVDGLCWKFPGRLQEVVDREGDRLSK